MNHFNRMQNNSHLNNKIDHMSRNIDEILQYLKNNRNNNVVYQYKTTNYDNNLSQVINSVAKDTTRNFLNSIHKKSSFKESDSSHSLFENILYKGMSNTILNIFDKIW